MPLITISSAIGCGGNEIALIVADGLNLEVYDDRKLLDLAPTAGVRSEDLKDMSEPGFFDRLFSRKPQVYMDYMDSIIYEVSRHGNGVILGHGSQMLLRDFGCALHIRIYAPEATRIQNLTELQGIGNESAKKIISKMDSKQKGFFHLAYNKDLDDPSLYDLIINTAKISYDSASKLIIETANSDEINTCSLTALDAMEKLSQIKKIQAALLENTLDDNMLIIDVPEKGVADLSGLSYSKEMIDLIIKVVKGIPGISEVRSEIVVAPPLYGGIKTRRE